MDAKKPKCPKGTRRNKKTGECERRSKSESSKTSKSSKSSKSSSKRSKSSKTSKSSSNRSSKSVKTMKHPSKITVYITCHGTDMPKKPIVVDPSVRILSQAGKFGCWGFFSQMSLNEIKKMIYFAEIKNQRDNTFLMLENIKPEFKRETHRDLTSTNVVHFLTEQDKEKLQLGEKTTNYRQSRHTLKTRIKNEDWQIYTPVIDHLYDFTDKKHRNQGIFIADMKNKPASFKFAEDDNLLKIMNDAKEEFHLKQEFREMKMKEFFSKHPSLHDEISKEIMENLDKIGADNLESYAFAVNDPELIDVLIKVTGKSLYDKILAILKDQYSDLEYSGTVLQSELVKFLKDAKFDIINIIDKSCRSYGGIMSKEKFAEINAKEDEASLLIDKTLGGNSRRISK